MKDQRASFTGHCSAYRALSKRWRGDAGFTSTTRPHHRPGCCSQYTSRAAELYKAALEKDVKKLSLVCPVSPTAAEAAKQGIDFLDSEVRPPHWKVPAQ